MYQKYTAWDDFAECIYCTCSCSPLPFFLLMELCDDRDPWLTLFEQSVPVMSSGMDLTACSASQVLLWWVAVFAQLHFLSQKAVVVSLSYSDRSCHYQPFYSFIVLMLGHICFTPHLERSSGFLCKPDLLNILTQKHSFYEVQSPLALSKTIEGKHTYRDMY